MPEEKFATGVERVSEELPGEVHDAPHLTRQALWKLDIRIIPYLTLMFLCSFVDRTNVGNAKILGLQEDTHMTDHQYAIGLCAFYATYIAIELSSNLVLKRMSPKLWLPLLTAVWGLFTMCLGFIQNFGSFVAVRTLLGLAEGGLLPGMIVYLSQFYKRTEIALRIGIFYTATSLSGAFGGLLARGLNAIDTTYKHGLEGWRWIFIVEGLLTIAIAVCTYFSLPNSIESAGFLSTEQKAHCRHRLDEQDRAKEIFSWEEVKRGILNLQVWLSALAYFSILCGIYSFGLFLPTIINNLKFASDPNEAQLWSVIPYAVAAVCTVFVAVLSDRVAMRGPIILCTLLIGIIGYGVISTSRNAHVQYGMTFMMATGLYSSVPCILSWNSNNSAGYYKRATTSALQLSIANCGGITASWLYQKKEAPHFHESHTIILSLLCAAWVLTAANVLWVRKINRDKTSGKYAAWEGKGDDRDPAFMMVM